MRKAAFSYQPSALSLSIGGIYGFFLWREFVTAPRLAGSFSLGVPAEREICKLDK